MTSRNMTNASEENQWPLPEARVIPDPLWQDVEILPENIRIAQTAAGVDWVLGQGSYGTVSFHVITNACLFRRVSKSCCI